MSHPRTLLATIREREMQQAKTQAEITNLWTEFGQSVREERKKLKIGATAFAKTLGYSTAMLAFLETGKRVWPMETARKAVEVLGR